MTCRYFKPMGPSLAHLLSYSQSPIAGFCFSVFHYFPSQQTYVLSHPHPVSSLTSPPSILALAQSTPDTLVPCTYQAFSHLKAFALAIPSAQKTLFSDIHDCFRFSLSFGSLMAVTLAPRPSLMASIKQRPAPHPLLPSPLTLPNAHLTI